MSHQSAPDVKSELQRRMEKKTAGKKRKVRPCKDKSILGSLKLILYKSLQLCLQQRKSKITRSKRYLDTNYLLNYPLKVFVRLKLNI